MPDYLHLIRAALAEDLIDGLDVTSQHFLDSNVEGSGWIEAREEAIVSGIGVVMAVFSTVDPRIRLQNPLSDGRRVQSGIRIIGVEGTAASIFKAERTALNFLCHLSGIATFTRRLVDATSEWGTKILCTRKTTPGLRALEIEAVRHGGGDVYRTNLSDSVLVKDNHEGILGGLKGVAERLADIRRENPLLAERIVREGKIEAQTEDDVYHAVEMGWRQILLDNFSVNAVRDTVAQWEKKVFLEVSGGVTLENIKDYAATGVKAISIGAITHSSRAIDFSLEVEWRKI